MSVSEMKKLKFAHEVGGSAFSVALYGSFMSVRIPLNALTYLMKILVRDAHCYRMIHHYKYGCTIITDKAFSTGLSLSLQMSLAQSLSTKFDIADLCLKRQLL